MKTALPPPEPRETDSLATAATKSKAPPAPRDYAEKVLAEFAKGKIPESFAIENGLIDPKSKIGIEFNRKMKAIYDSIIIDEYKKIIGPDIRFILSTDNAANACALRMEKPPTIIINAGLFKQVIKLDDDFKERLAKNTEGQYYEKLIAGKSECPVIDSIEDLGLLIAHEAWHLVEQKKSGINRRVYKSEEGMSDMVAFRCVHACGLSVEKASFFVHKLSALPGGGGWMEQLADSHLMELNREKLAQLAVAAFPNPRPEIGNANAANLNFKIDLSDTPSQKLEMIGSYPSFGAVEKLKFRRPLLNKELLEEVRDFVLAESNEKYWSTAAKDPQELKSKIISQLTKFRDLIPQSKYSLSRHFLSETLDGIRELQKKLSDKEFRAFVANVVKIIVKFNPATASGCIRTLSKICNVPAYQLTKETAAYHKSRTNFISAIQSEEDDQKLARISKAAKVLAKDHDLILKTFGELNAKFMLFEFPIIQFYPRDDQVPWQCLYGKITTDHLIKAAVSTGLVYDFTILKEVMSAEGVASIHKEDYLRHAVIGQGLTHMNSTQQEIFYFAPKVFLMEQFEATDSVTLLEKAAQHEKLVELIDPMCREEAKNKFDNYLREINAKLQAGEDLPEELLENMQVCVSYCEKGVPLKNFEMMGNFIPFIAINGDYLEKSCDSRKSEEKVAIIMRQYLKRFMMQAFAEPETSTSLAVRQDLTDLLFSEKYKKERRYIVKIGAINYVPFFDINIIKILEDLPESYFPDRRLAFANEIRAQYAHPMHEDDQENLEKLLRNCGVPIKSQYSVGEILTQLERPHLSMLEVDLFVMKLFEKLDLNERMTNAQVLRAYLVLEAKDINNYRFQGSFDRIRGLRDLLRGSVHEPSTKLADKIKLLPIFASNNSFSAAEERSFFENIVKEINQLAPKKQLTTYVELLTNYSLTNPKDTENAAEAIYQAARSNYLNYTQDQVPEIKQIIDSIWKIKPVLASQKFLDKFASGVRLRESECRYIREKIDRQFADQRHAKLDNTLVFEVIKEAMKDDSESKRTIEVVKFLLNSNPDPEILLKNILAISYNYNDDVHQAKKKEIARIRHNHLKGHSRDSLQADDSNQYSLWTYLQLIFEVPYEKLDVQEQNLRSKLSQQASDMHAVFISSKVIHQSLILRELIIPEKEKTGQYERILGFALRSIFPNQDQDAKVIQTFIVSYAKNLHPSQRSIFACMLLNSIRNQNAAGAESAEFLLDILSNNALQIKSGQKAAVTNGVPEKYRKVLIRLTEGADKPFYWEYSEWINAVKATDSIEPNNLLHPSKCGDLAEIRGSASVSVVGSLAIDGAPTGQVISIIRPETPERTIGESEILKNVIADLRKRAPHLESQINIFEKLILSSDARLLQELSTKMAMRLFSLAQEMYSPISIIADGQEFGFKVPKVLASGTTMDHAWREFQYIIMEELPGKSIARLKESGELDPAAIKRYCKVIVAMEFYNIAMGRFCSDRTNGNILIDPTTPQIGQIDFLGMLDRKWEPNDYAPVMDLLAKIMKGTSADAGQEGSLSKILLKLAEEKREAGQGELIQELEKSLLAINVFAQELDSKELLSAALSGIIGASGGPLKAYIQENYEQFERMITENVGITLPPRQMLEGMLFGPNVPAVALINMFTKLNLFQFKRNPVIVT